MTLHLCGVYAPIVTPFDGDEIDVAGLVSNLERYGRTGLAGIVVLGSNSEAPLLDDDESERVVEISARFQACNDSICLRPQVATMRVTVKVDPGQ